MPHGYVTLDVGANWASMRGRSRAVLVQSARLRASIAFGWFVLKTRMKAGWQLEELAEESQLEYQKVDGRVVRWWFEAVTDVQSIDEKELAHGVEVYSRSDRGP